MNKESRGREPGDTLDGGVDVRGVELVPLRTPREDNLVVTNFHNIALVGSVQHQKNIADRQLPSDKLAFERIGAAVRLNLQQLERNIEQARRESGRFFNLTLVFAGVGFLIVLSGVALLFMNKASGGLVTTGAGIIPEVIASLFLGKDKELRKTIEAYHQHMLNSQQILTMIDVAETISDGEERDLVKRDIIQKVLGIGLRN